MHIHFFEKGVKAGNKILIINVKPCPEKSGIVNCELDIGKIGRFGRF